MLQHIVAIPFHPLTNGQSECMVRTNKNVLCRIVYSNWNQRLANFLLQQYIMLYTATGRRPEELLMNCCLVSLLDWLIPNMTIDCPLLHEAPELQPPPLFHPGNLISARNYNGIWYWTSTDAYWTFVASQHQSCNRLHSKESGINRQNWSKAEWK